ncbi:MAG: putative 4-mercaptohistidine N1-methyltransferase [Opitutales bacterium]|jgi:putative 4-mercaptohistidine N1-methyltranferase|nr:putative 4-mercaptohistidine N1-methyltransferase [Opitutales bacterium]MDP4643548.1 putative 4-mercaptohistidine N1-methyltransferase [Opitutales bacterium]MDP4694281.1 putative 4-mercaptohistidine N1-methyltransferase [Opitutales bacterium]MDP4778370.1 putative 4-mercaptohistidine N1-methyltransferase [Opitutales bacterium]MDP4879555.1 putative 4-mercaptohistidine N1-methyltransferase [Opitutales bacterium]
MMPTNPYESDELLQQYLVFHYATATEQFPYGFGGADALDFPKRCALEGVDFSRLSEPARALDLGCSVGRSSFELARHCSEVIGIDYSHAFIDVAKRLQVDGQHPATRLDEGSATTALDVIVDPVVDRSRVSFEQGDAQHIRPDIGQFDVVIACNLICRLPEPMRLLARLPDLLKPGGQLFITTPFTWLEEYTPSQNWLGDGAQDSFAGLRRALEPAFGLQRQWDMPFLIREHARKFQYSIAQASCWTRN